MSIYIITSKTMYILTLIVVIILFIYQYTITLLSIHMLNDIYNI